MSLDRTRVIVIQHRQQYLALACITCHCRYDLANDVDSVTINPLVCIHHRCLDAKKYHDPENVLSRPTNAKTRQTAMGNDTARV